MHGSKVKGPRPRASLNSQPSAIHINFTEKLGLPWDVEMGFRINLLTYIYIYIYIHILCIIHTVYNTLCVILCARVRKFEKHPLKIYQLKTLVMLNYYTVYILKKKCKIWKKVYISDVHHSIV